MAIALLHSDGMSSMLGGRVGELQNFVSLRDGCIFWWAWWRLGCCWCLAYSCRWAEFLSLVRRCICLVFAFVIGGRSVLGSVEGVCSVIDHNVCVFVWYVSIMLMTYFAALSMCVCVMPFDVVRSCMQLNALSSVVWVLAFPNW